MKEPLRIYLAFCCLLVLSACASTIRLDSLSKPSNPTDTIAVREFRYGGGSLGLDTGIYTIEYENSDGKFYRGPYLSVLIPKPLNMNKEKYPDNKFPGGLFVPKTNNPKSYAIYYYQLNLPGSPGPTINEQARNVASTVAPAPSMSSGLGGGIGAGIVAGMIERDRGQIVLVPPTDEIDIHAHTARP